MSEENENREDTAVSEDVAAAAALEDINIEESMSRDYIDYSMSVIVGRALPDARDGMKPVHRRCLFAMHELGTTYSVKHVKSARVVGEVIGKYHPHGDSSVYDTIVRMAAARASLLSVVPALSLLGASPRLVTRPARRRTPPISSSSSAATLSKEGIVNEQKH